MNEKKYKILISGGGTGGHIFPAISIANAVKEKYPETEILFIGAEGRMEMEKVPAAGYDIVGLPIQGLQRKLSLQIFKFFYKLIKSLLKVKKVIKTFNPDIAIGVGGYASGPALKMADNLRVPYLLQEQNSYPGITNKILAQKAQRICVAYDNMDKFFPANKIIKTGNPVRQEITKKISYKAETINKFNLSPNKPPL